MIKREAEAFLIGKLCDNNKHQLIQDVIELIDVMIKEVRISNDDVTLFSDFKKNQGKIQGLQKLKRYLNDGIPGQ